MNIVTSRGNMTKMKTKLNKQAKTFHKVILAKQPIEKIIQDMKILLTQRKKGRIRKQRAENKYHDEEKSVIAII